METAEIPVLLLKNGGLERNMCSLNSIIQLLRHIPEFQAEASSLKNISPLLNSLQYIISKCGTGIKQSALALREHLACATNQPLNSGAQYDTMELFTHLMNHIPSGLFYFETSVEHRFLVENRPSSCPSCKEGPQPVSGSEKILQVPIPSSPEGLSLDYLLRRLFSVKTQLDGWRCATCLSNNPATPKIPYLEKLSISRHPQYLILQILRMEYKNGKIVKNMTPVYLPNEVLVNNIKYSVIGTISHMGTAEAGHNRAYLRHGSSWFLCEDACMPEKTAPVDDNFEQTYCVLLRRCDNDSVQPHEQPMLKKCKVVLEPLPKLKNNESYADALKKPKSVLPRQSHSCSAISSSEFELTRESRKRLFSSMESINSLDSHQEACKGCGKMFSRLLVHLSKSKSCSLYYDMEKMIAEHEAERKRKNQVKMQKSRMKQQRTDSTDYQSKAAACRQHRRMREAEKNPEEYREKEAEGRQH